MLAEDDDLLLEMSYGVSSSIFILPLLLMPSTSSSLAISTSLLFFCQSQSKPPPVSPRTSCELVTDIFSSSEPMLPSKPCLKSDMALSSCSDYGSVVNWVHFMYKHCLQVSSDDVRQPVRRPEAMHGWLPLLSLAVGYC